MDKIEQHKKTINILTGGVVAVISTLAIFYRFESIPAYFKRYLVIGAFSICSLLIFVIFREQINLMKALIKEKGEKRITGIIISIITLLIFVGIVTYMIITNFFGIKLF